MGFGSTDTAVVAASSNVLVVSATPTWRGRAGAVAVMAPAVAEA